MGQITLKQIERLLDGRRNLERAAPDPLQKDFFSLDGILGLLALLGNPEDAVPSIHVAGTKGKGSTCLFLENIFIEAGYLPGVYLSPHLEDIYERIRLGGQRPKASAIIGAFQPLAKAMDEMDLALEPPSFFEAMTALAFLIFKRGHADANIIEVGLGGRLDATNVITPMVSVITNIGLEHTFYLGDTHAKIAAEKAGIIKPGVPVVTAATGEALRVIRKVARKNGSPLSVLGEDFSIETASNGTGEFQGTRFNIRGLAPSALGEHQFRNAAVAIEAASIAAGKFRGILKPENIRAAVAKTLPPGRAELISENPRVLIDVAHTKESAAALSDVVETLDRGHKGTRALIFAAMADKDMPAIFKALEKHFDVFIFTTARTERSESPENLAKVFRTISKKTALIARTVSGAKSAALDVAGKSGFITAAGSFYLAGMLRKQNWK